MRSSESSPPPAVDRGGRASGPRWIAWTFVAVALGAMGVYWATQPALDAPTVVPVGVVADEVRTVESLVSDAAPLATAPQRATTTAEFAAPALPVWPGDVEESLPEPPGEGPLVVTVIDRGGLLVRGAQVRLAAPISAPISPPRPGGAAAEPAGTPTDQEFLGVTDAHGRCRVRAVAGQTLLATDRRPHAGIAPVGDEALRTGRVVVLIGPGVGLHATVIGFDGKGVAGAVVTAQAIDSGRSFTGSADAAGVCLWWLDGDCRYDVTARDGDRLAETARLAAGVGAGETVRIRLLGVAAIDGRVLDPHGVAAAGASVRVTSDPRSPERRRGGFEFSAATDPDGAFHLPLPGPGRYWVTAEHPDWAPAPAGDFTILVGKPTQASLRLAVRAEFQGVVRWKDGPPIPGAALRFETRGVFGQYGWITVGLDASTGADGTYRLEKVSSGVAYNATCTPDPSRPHVRMERQGVQPSPQHFVFEQASSMGAGVDVALTAAGSTVPHEVVTRLRVRRNDARDVWLPGVDEVVAVIDGRARIARLTPGTAYTVDVRAPGLGRIRSEVFVAGETASLAVTLPRSARLEVRVLAGREGAAVGAEVVLQEELAHGMSWGAKADIRGRVAFADLPPGTFTVSARRDEARPVRQVVEVTAGRTQRVELRLQE